MRRASGGQLPIQSKMNDRIFSFTELHRRSARSEFREPVSEFLLLPIGFVLFRFEIDHIGSFSGCQGKSATRGQSDSLSGIEKPDYSHAGRIFATSIALAKPKRCKWNNENHSHGCFRLVANRVFVLWLLSVSDSASPDTTVRCAFGARDNLRIAEHFRSGQTKNAHRQRTRCHEKIHR